MGLFSGQTQSWRTAETGGEWRSERWCNRGENTRAGKGELECKEREGCRCRREVNKNGG